MIAKADIRRLQKWMGHADITTTMRYLHYGPRDDRPRYQDRVESSRNSLRKTGARGRLHGWPKVSGSEISRTRRRVVARRVR